MWDLTVSKAMRSSDSSVADGQDENLRSRSRMASHRALRRRPLAGVPGEAGDDSKGTYTGKLRGKRPVDS